MESADQAVAEVGTSQICSSHPSCHPYIFFLKYWEPGGSHFLLTETVSPYLRRKPCILKSLLSLFLGWQLLEILLWFVYNVSPHPLPPPLFCPSSTGPKWSPYSSKSALPENSPCWTLPLASLSGAPWVRMGFFLSHSVPYSSPLFVPLHVPGFCRGDRGLDLCDSCGDWKENRQAFCQLEVGEGEKSIENNFQGTDWNGEKVEVTEVGEEGEHLMRPYSF